MAEADSHSSGSGASWFRTTRWTVVLRSGETNEENRAESLNRLCETYWKPLYCYARQHGFAEEDAKDLTQGFFAHFLQSGGFGRADPQRGRFRSFLLGCMKHFLSKERRRVAAHKRGGHLTAVPPAVESATGETMFTAILDRQDTPEQAYDKSWAITMLDDAVARLEQDYERQGKGALFRELRLLLWDADSPGTYAKLGARLNMSEAAVKMAVKRLRSRARQHLREAVADTVEDEFQIDPEYHYIKAILTGGK